MPKLFPDLNTLLLDLNEPGWVEPETKIEASLRLLKRLSTLPSARWNQLHWRIRKWYDQCYEVLHKRHELFTYPNMETKAFNYEEFFKHKLQQATLIKRIAELFLTDPTLTGNKIHEILQMEGFQPKAGACNITVLAMQTLMGYLHEQSYLNINTIYQVPENESSNNVQS